MSFFLEKFEWKSHFSRVLRQEREIENDISRSSGKKLSWFSWEFPWTAIPVTLLSPVALFVAKILPSGFFVTRNRSYGERRNCIFWEVDDKWMLWDSHCLATGKIDLEKHLWSRVWDFTHCLHSYKPTINIIRSPFLLHVIDHKVKSFSIFLSFCSCK